jgi:hypothetical protein
MAKPLITNFLSGAPRPGQQIAQMLKQFEVKQQAEPATGVLTD